MEASLKHIQGPLASVSKGLLASQPDTTLVALARRGHNGAFAALYGRYEAPISRFVGQILGKRSNDDAADVTQEVFAAAFAALPSRERDIPFKPWLYKIARNRSIDFLRARKPITAELDSEQIAAADTPDSRLEQREDLRLVVTAIESLPERQREALVLRELAGLSHSEIATTLDTTVPSVKQLLTRGRASVNRSAGVESDRSNRELRHALGIAFPAIPMSGQIGALLSQLGLAGAGAGGALTKAAAVVLAIGAIGGSAAGVNEIAASVGDTQTASQVAAEQGGQSAGLEGSINGESGARAGAKDDSVGGDNGPARRRNKTSAESGGSAGDARGQDSRGGLPTSGLSAPSLKTPAGDTPALPDPSLPTPSLPKVDDPVENLIPPLPQVDDTADKVTDKVDEVVQALPDPGL